jgi:hypothetical protein
MRKRWVASGTNRLARRKLQLGNVRQPTIKGYTVQPYPHSTL